jgi:SNF2 family DNA or RNA helicase
MRVTIASPPWANGRFIAVTSPYDPGIIAAIKATPGRRWDSSRHVWLIPCTPESFDSLLERLPGYAIAEVADSLRRAIDQRRAALNGAALVKSRGDGKVDYDYITEPYAHQRAGLDFLHRMGSAALLWEMGTGKTKTAIDYCEWLKNGTTTFRVLVICPNTVKRNWATEIEKHAGHRDYIVPDGPLARRRGEIGSAGYTIVNCEMLSAKTTADALLAREWDVVIADESTRFKTPTAKRTKTLHKMRAKRRLILTGSPITGKPQDAWAQLEFVEPGLLGSWWAFVDRYLIKDYFGAVTGVKDGMAQELRARIESRSYRVLKSQVLDLPPKVYENRWVELDGKQAAAYKQMKAELRVALEGHDILAPTILTQLLRLTQITAGLIGERGDYLWLEPSAKLTELDELLNEELAGEQVVVFGLYQRELEKLWLRYAPPSTGYDEWDLPAILYGPTPEKRRHELVDQFQSGQRRLLFAQAHTGGIGINLTAARTAVYYTRGWSLEDYIQSQDRLHRIGQQGTVTIINLVAKSTVDVVIDRALAAKQNMADILTGDVARKLAAEVLGD